MIKLMILFTVGYFLGVLLMFVFTFRYVNELEEEIRKFEEMKQIAK